jgi:hypothetical protein
MDVTCECGITKDISIDYYKRLVRKSKNYQCLRCACEKSWTEHRKLQKSEQMKKLWGNSDYKRNIQWKKRLGLIFR